MIAPMVALLWGCGGDSPANAVAADSLTLVYSHNVDGEIEPCG